MTASHHIPIGETLSSEDFFSHYLKPHQPVLLKGRITGIKAVGLWTLNNIAERGRDQIVPVKTGESYLNYIS